MLMTIPWVGFGFGLMTVLLLYYAALACVFGREAEGRQPEPPPQPPPPKREEWMEQILASLEETVLHAQAKRYHPDEVLLALVKKIEEIRKM